MFVLSGLTGYESGFLVNMLIATIWENNRLLPSFLILPPPFATHASSLLSLSLSQSPY